MGKRKNRRGSVILIILLFLIAGSLIWHYTSITEFNNKLHLAHSTDDKEKSYMDLVARDLATSSWIKRDYDLYGESVNLTAITYDGTLYNKDKEVLNDWTLKVKITKDCFINQMWNGTLEIHQYNEGREIVENINLANYDLDEIKLKYLYDGDLLIPLSKGDYFIYFPSEKFKETSIEGNESITIGGIFYFLEDMALDDYDLEYHNYKTYFEGPSFIITLTLIILWFLILLMLIVEHSAYKRAKKEMEYKNRIEHAEMENKAKSAFLANMSHEIRTPINTVIGLDTMILRETKDSEIKKYAKEIKNASTMLLSLINGILDSSKIEAGKMELIPAEYSLKQLIFDVRSMTKTAMEAKNLEYIFDIDENIPDKLFGDDVRLKQIIINILTNATKYTEKGSVKLTIKQKKDDEKFKLFISVKDTGMGIKEEDIDHLTDSYQRLDEEKNRHIEGTGLGLGLVTGILELMNSKLEVKSTYGKGSDFYFTVEQSVVDSMPIGKIDFENMEVEDDVEYETSFIAQDASILAVDDNPMNLMVFEQLLKDTKVKVTKAGSGIEALNLTKKEKYDIIFMDHMMPEMDGIETFKRIKNQEDGLNNDTVVIILTANALQGAREEYLNIGFDDFLPKPIQPEILENAVMVYLPKNKIQKQFNNAKNAKKKSKIDLSNVQIEGVDLAYGIEHAGDENGLLSIMNNFLLMADDDANELNDYYKQLVLDNNNEKALDSYRIKVHAMKSSAGLFGALQVYGAAAFLEKAAREREVKEIMVSTPFFLKFWNELKTNVENFVYTLKGDDEATKDVNKENLINLLHQLNTSMKTYDIKNADMIMSEIEKYKLTGKEETLKKLKLAVSKLEAEKIENLCNELLK